MAIVKQEASSQVQVKINFMKSQERISELRSKASYRVPSPGNFSVVCEITDGRSLMVQTAEGGFEDWTADLIGQTANLRLTQEQFDVLNSEIHEINGVGASVVYDLACDVRVGYITTRKEGEVLSVTLYPDTLVEVEPVEIQRVGSVLSRDALRAGLKANRERQERKRLAATNRVARASAEAANSEESVDVFL